MLHLSLILGDNHLSYFSPQSVPAAQPAADTNHAENTRMLVCLFVCCFNPRLESAYIFCCCCYNKVPHALIIFQDNRVDRSLGEVQPTSGMGKVHMRRKRQSMVVMARRLTPSPGYLRKERKSANNLRCRIMQRARIVSVRLVSAQVKSAGCSGRRCA